MSSYFDSRFCQMSESCLFCFAHAGGWPSIFDRWSDYFPECVSVMPIKLPGRADRIDEMNLNNVDEIVKNITAEILLHCKDKNISLYGTCFGALCAYEVAKQMEALGLSIRNLYISSQMPPSIPRTRKSIFTLSDQEFILWLIREGAISPELACEKNLISFLLPSIRADYQAYDQYKYRMKKMDIPIHVFWGENDKQIDVARIVEWNKETTNICTYHCIKGANHLFNSIEQEQIINFIKKEYI